MMFFFKKKLCWRIFAKHFANDTSLDLVVRTYLRQSIVSFALQLANSGVSAKTMQKHCKLETKPILQKVDRTHFIYCNLGPTAIILNKLCSKTSCGVESGDKFIF